MTDYQVLFRKIKIAVILFAFGLFLNVPLLNIIAFILATVNLGNLSSVSKSFQKAQKFTKYGIITAAILMALETFSSLFTPDTLIQIAQSAIEAGSEASLNAIPFYGYIVFGALIVVKVLNGLMFLFFTKYLYEGLDQYTNRYLNVLNKDCKELAKKCHKWVVFFVSVCWVIIVPNFVEIYYYNEFVAAGGLANAEAYELYDTTTTSYLIYYAIPELVQFVAEIIALVHTIKLESFLKKLQLTTPLDSFGETTVVDDSIPVDSVEKEETKNENNDDWKEDFK